MVEVDIKRVYETPSPKDGQRILVDRLWPRGLSKDKAKIDYWAKEVSPSAELRKWYQHDADKWQEFKRLYFKELDENQLAVDELMHKLENGPVTFLFSSRELKLNNAYALREYLSGK